MMRWAVLLVLMASPAMAHTGGPPAGVTYVLMLYTEHWSIAFNAFPNEESCKLAASAFENRGPFDRNPAWAKCFPREQLR